MHIPNLFKPLDLPTQLVVQNPLTADMVFSSTHCEIYPCKTFASDHNSCKEYYPESAGFYTPDIVNEVVPGKGQQALKLHPVKLIKLLSPEMIKTFFTSVGGGSFIRLSGWVTLNVGGTSITVDYSEDNVPICLVYPLHTCGSVMQEFE